MKNETPADVRPAAPYEPVLMKAFDRLTSQVLIFLLAYLMLVIGLGVLAPDMTERVRTLLYALPVLGIGAHMWQRQRTLTREAQRRGINVTAGMVSGDAHVTGVRTGRNSANRPEDVQVRVGLASGRSVVEGAVIGADDSAHAQATDAQYLLATFEQLSPPQRRKLITSAQRLLDDPHA